VSVFVDVGLSIHYASAGKYDSSEAKEKALLATTLSAAMFLIYIAVIFIPSWITQKRSLNHH
jgi:uncharacterized protein (UPF0254 family)